MKSETGILKWPLIIAAIVVVVRVVFERMGVPETINNLLSIAAMHTIIVPVYIAIQLGRRNAARPFFSLFLQIAVYAVLTRIMILPTYWAGVNPELTATISKNGEISSVEISYLRDTIRQYLRYGAMYDAGLTEQHNQPRHKPLPR